VGSYLLPLGLVVWLLFSACPVGHYVAAEMAPQPCGAASRSGVTVELPAIVGLPTTVAPTRFLVDVGRSARGVTLFELPSRLVVGH